MAEQRRRRLSLCTETYFLPGHGWLTCNCAVPNLGAHQASLWCLDGEASADKRHLLQFPKIAMRRLHADGGLPDDATDDQCVQCVSAAYAWVAWAPTAKSSTSYQKSW